MSHDTLIYTPPTLHFLHHPPPYSLFPSILEQKEFHSSFPYKKKLIIMSGVWVFKNNGVIRLVENPGADEEGNNSAGTSRRKVLVHLPTNEVVASYKSLEQILTGLGWERYYRGDPQLLQFHKHSSIDLISLPRDFSRFNSVYMYDIVVKNPNIFHVRDM